jgi:hypothetical protein
MIDKKKILAVTLMAVLVAAVGVFIVTDTSADDEVYFMDGGIRYVVTDEANKTVSVAPLETGKYATDTVLTIPATATDGTTTYNVTGIADKAFNGASGLYGIALPEGLITIGDSAFRSSAVYQDLVLPSTVQFIGEDAFNSCAITGLDLSMTAVTEIADSAFYSCKNLKWVKLNDSIETIGPSAFAADAKVSEFDFGGSPVKSIEDRAFQNFGTGINFTIPASVTEIAPSAFSSAKIAAYSVEDGNTAFKAVAGCLLNFDGDRLLNYPISSTATSFVVPAGVTTLAEDSFYYATSLKAISLDNSVVLEDYSLTMTGIETMTITQTGALPEGYSGVIQTYFTRDDGYWTITNISIKHLIIDSEYAVDMAGLSGKGGVYVDFTERSTNTVNGDFQDDGKEVPSADRAGKRFSCNSSDASRVFELDNTRFVTVTVEPKEGGTIEGAGSIAIGEECTLTATPNSGYMFAYWNGNPTLTDPTYKFIVTGDVNMVATFVITENTFFTVPSEAEFQMTKNLGIAPENAKPSSYNYYNFILIDYTDKKDNGDGTVTYSYKLENGTYGAIVSGDGYVTYKDLFTKKANTEYTRVVTVEMLTPEGKSPTYVDRSVDTTGKGGDDIGGILVSVNKQNHLQLGVGQVAPLMVYRQWQAVGNTMQNPFLEPPVIYKITDLDGNPVDDVIDIAYGGDGDVNYKITALKEGTVVVTMYMEAFTLNVTNDLFYGATWPELTAVFVVTVGESASFDTGFTYSENGTIRPFDAEVDIVYYDHNYEGCIGTFTPAAGTEVSVYNPVLGKVGIIGFEKGTATEEDGEWTVSLTEGRNIIQMTNNGQTLYQVVTVMPVVIEINGVDSSMASWIVGEENTIVFKSTHGDYGGILNSKSKLAGIYNSSATINYVDEDGNRLATAKQPAYGHYFFVTTPEYQTLKVTIPASFEGSEYTVTGVGINLGGFDGAGDHRTWFKPLTTQLGIKIASFLPEITLPITHDYTVTNKGLGFEVTYRVLQDGVLVDEKVIASGESATFNLAASTYTFQVYKGDVLLDERIGEITTDLSMAFNKYTINSRGIDADAAGKYTVEYTTSCPKYTICTDLTNIDGNKADETNLDVNIFAYEGDTIVSDVVPNEAGKDIYSEYVSSATMAGSIILNLYKSAVKTIYVPAGAEVSLGMKVAHFVAFKEVEPESVTTEGGKDVYTYRLASKQTYALRVNVADNDDLITLGAKITFGNDDFSTLDVVESGLMVAEGKTSKTTVYPPTQYSEVSDVYGNADTTGSIYLSVGETRALDTFRVWQALDSITSNYFIEPVYNYSVVSGSDVISIDDDGIITPLKNGVAFVAVSYDAMNFIEITKPELKTPTFYPASLAKNAYVVAVIVGDSESPGAYEGLTINAGMNDPVKTKLAGDNFDCDTDVVYFFEGDSVNYNVTTSSSATVKVYNPVLGGNTVTSFNEGKTVKTDDGYTITLTEGRNIVVITDNGNTYYQVVRASKATVTITNNTSAERGEANQVIPGDELTITISGLEGLQKMAGTYNPQTDGIVLVDSFGNKFVGTASGQYKISIESVTVTVTVPGDISGTYDLIGYMTTGGYGDPVGGHHLITRETGRQPNFVALYVSAVLGYISPISMEVADYYTATFDTKVEVDLIIQNQNKPASGGTIDFGTFESEGSDVYYFLNCSTYNLISAEFYADGKETTRIYLNTEDLTINGVTIPKGRAVVAADLYPGLFSFKVVFGSAWASMTFVGSIDVIGGTYVFEDYMVAGEKYTLPELPMEAKIAVDAEGKIFKGWVMNDKILPPGTQIDATSNIYAVAELSDDFIIFDGDSGTYTDDEGNVTTFDTLNDAMKSTEITADVKIIGETSFTGSISMNKRNIIVADGGVLNANGSLSIAKNYSLIIKEGGEFHNGTGTVSNSGKMIIEGTATSRGNVNGSGVFEGTITALPYFEVGDTFTFIAGSGTIEHTPGQDKCAYNPDVKVTLTMTVESLPSTVNNGWDDFGSVRITDITFSEKSDIIYVLSYSIGKVTINNEVILSYFKITSIDDSVVAKINERTIGIVLPNALEGTVFADNVTIIDEAYYTDTHGSKVYYSIDETATAYMNGYGGYSLYSYDTEDPDYRFCEQGTVTHVDYAEGMTTYDTKLSPWSANDMVSCDYWVCGSFADMIGTALTYEIEFTGDYVTFSQNSVKAATNAIITIDDKEFHVNNFVITATPYEDTPDVKYHFNGWSVESGAAVTDNMTVTAYVEKAADKNVVTLVAGDGCASIDGKKTIEIVVAYGAAVSVNDNKITIDGVTYTAKGATETGYTVVFDEWFGVPESGTITDSVTITAIYDKFADARTVTLVAGKNCSGIDGKTTCTVVTGYGSGIVAVGSGIIIGDKTLYASPITTEGAVYDFAGWTGIPADGKVTQDITITANYSEPVKMYTVTLTAGDHGSVSSNSISVRSGSAITVLNNIINIGGYSFTATPEPSTSSQTVTFDSWSIPGGASTVTKDMTIDAIFKVTYTPKAVDGYVNVDISGTGDAKYTVKVPSDAKTLCVQYGNGLTTLINDAGDLAGKEITTSLGEIINTSKVKGTGYELIFMVGSTQYTGKMMVTLPAQPQDGKVATVYYIDGDSSSKMDTVSITDSGITFSTNHNSMYVVAYDDVPNNNMLYIILAIVAIVLIAIVVVASLRHKKQ